MCIGLPMKVIEAGFGVALCEDRGTQRQIDTMLVGEVKAGDWLLVFIDAAREVISEEDALKIGDALKAVELAMNGTEGAADAMDLLFADLIANPPSSQVQ